MMRRWLFLCALVLLAASAFAKQIPEPTQRLVNDFAGILSASEIETLEKKLVAFDDSTSTQIAIVIDRSLEGEDVFDYSFRLAQKWGIGQKGKENGILIYFSVEDRQIRIQVGYGAEGFLPDAYAKRIIQADIVPNFKAQQYYNGLDQATTNIIALHNGEYTQDDSLQEGIPIELIFFIILIVIILISMKNRNDGGDDDGGYYRGGRYYGPGHGGGGWWLGGGGGSGGGWSGGGGGGFGGFGGGGFGGGGAGGSW